MEVKQCSKCKEVKPLSKFNRRLNRKGINVGTSYCSLCVKKGARQWKLDNPEKHNKWRKNNYQKNKEEIKKENKEYYLNNIERYKENAFNYYAKHNDGRYHVYLLPEEHYCGYTNNVFRREIEHRSTLGRITEGMEVVMSFDTRKEALIYESMFHTLGWYGAKENP